MGTLTVDLFGKVLKNPIMNASGTLGYGREIEPLWGVECLGAYVTKGLSAEPHGGNPPPRVWEERSGMINSIGLQNVGVRRFFHDYFPLFREKQVPVVVNFFGFSDDEYLQCASLIPDDELIIALEANLSCPNIKRGGISFGKEPDTVYRIVKELKTLTAAPLLVKLTPEVKSIVDTARAAEDAGADGLTIINTLPAAVVNVKERSIPLKGGLSGPLLKPIALRAVADVSRSVAIPIIGVGGIMDHLDALAFFMAGARAVQVGTATFVDPFTIPKIVDQLQKYVDTCGIECVDSIVGIARGEG